MFLYRKGIMENGQPDSCRRAALRWPRMVLVCGQLSQTNLSKVQKNSTLQLLGMLPGGGSIIEVPFKCTLYAARYPQNKNHLSASGQAGWN